MRRLKFILGSSNGGENTKENSEVWISKKDFIKSIWYGKKQIVFWILNFQFLALHGAQVGLYFYSWYQISGESVKVKVWKCESESVKVKVCKWKCASENVNIKVWK